MSRLARAVHAWWLRMKLRAARFDMDVIEAEYTAAPARMQHLRQHISSLHRQLQKLEGGTC